MVTPFLTVPQGLVTKPCGTERIADHLINVGKSILRLGLIANFESQLAKK